MLTPRCKTQRFALRAGRIANRKTGRREERSEAFSAARHSPLSRLDARFGCETHYSQNHSIHRAGISRFTQEVYEAIQR